MWTGLLRGLTKTSESSLTLCSTRAVPERPWALIGELAELKGDDTGWLTGPEYAALRHRLGPHTRQRRPGEGEA